MCQRGCPAPSRDTWAAEGAWYHVPLSGAHIGIKGREACVGRIWNKTPAWLSGIEADLTLVAGFASFLAVVDHAV